MECTVLHAIIWLSEYVTHVIRTQSCNPSTYSLICLPVHRWLMPVLTQAFIKLSPLISTDLTVPRVNYVASPVNVWPDRWYRLQLDAGQGVLYDASDLLACVKLWYGHHMEGHLEQTIWYRDWFSSLQNFRNSSLRVLEFWFRSNFKLNFFFYIICPTVWYHILKWHCLWRNIHIISMFIVFLHMKWMACLKGTIWYWVRGV